MDYIKYIPLEMNDITEYKELGNAVGPTFTEVKSKMESIINNHFLSLLDETGVNRMEKIMGIKGMEAEPLEKRKLYIITKANNTLPYTIRNLKTKIRSLLDNDGFTITMTYNQYKLTIILALSNYDKINYVRESIEAMIPCNIILEIGILYNKYRYFNKYKYSELTSMTHWYMKTHEFEDGGSTCNIQPTIT